MHQVTQLIITGVILLLVLEPVSANLKKYAQLQEVEKKSPQITQRPILGRRNASQVCASGHNLCPNSLGGGCCPDNYKCAKKNCYAVNQAPSTCLGKVGWYPCAAKYGGEYIKSVSKLLSYPNSRFTQEVVVQMDTTVM